MGQIIYPYTDGANYIYDNTKIEVADGVARLVQNTATGLDPTFAWKLNESSYSGQAGEISDASGNGNTGHSLTSETLVAGKYGNAVESPQLKSDSVITLGSGNGSFTLSWWMKARASIAVPHRLVLQYDSSGSPFYIYVGSIDHAQFTVNDAGNTSRTAYFDLTDFYDDTWHHFIWSVDISDWTYRIYKDGVLFDSYTFNISTDRKADSTALQFGTKDGAQNFNGIMDEIIGFGRLLTDEEISTLYNNEYTGGNGALYPTDKPAIITTNATSVGTNASWLDFVEILGANNAGSVGYQLSEDGTNWYYWNGTNWTAAGTGQYNDATTVNDNIGSFSTLTGKIYVKAFLISDGNQQVELDQLTIDYALVEQYGAGNTAAVALSSDYRAGNTGNVNLPAAYKAGNTGYVGNKAQYNAGNSGAVELSGENKAGNTANVELTGSYKAGATADVFLESSYKTGNTGAVELADSKATGNTGYVGDKTSYQTGNAGNVFLSETYKAGNTGYVSIGGIYRTGNTGDVKFNDAYNAGNTGNVATGTEYRTGNTGAVQTGTEYHAGNTGAVELSDAYGLGNTVDVKLLKPVSNTVSVVVVPTFYELRDFEIFNLIDCYISMKGVEGNMQIIKGAKEYIYLRIKDKFGNIPDISEHWVSFSLEDSGGQRVVDSAAVERVQYTDEEEEGYVYRYLLDTSALSAGNYKGIFTIENGDELIIRRAEITVIE